MMMVDIPLKSAKIDGEAQTIALPVEDVVAALVKAVTPMTDEELAVVAVRWAKEFLHAQNGNRA